MADCMELSNKSLQQARSLCSPDHQRNLMLAFENREFVTFQNILTQGVNNGYIDPNFWYDDPHNGRLLDIACQKPDNDQYIECLLSCGSDPNKVNDLHKKSPLHLAVELGELNYTKLLIEDARTNINIPDDIGSPPLFYAAKSHKADKDHIIVALLNHQKININHVNYKGHTAFHIASDVGSKETLLCLLEPYLSQTDTGCSVKVSLLSLAKNGYIDLDSVLEPNLDFFLENYPYLVNNLPNNNDKVVRNGAGMNDNVVNRLYEKLSSRNIDEFISLLKKNERYINSCEGYCTFLQYACICGLYRAVKELLSLGANPNETSQCNVQTPIMIACYNGYEEIVRLLVSNNTVSYQPIYFDTVLHSVIKGSMHPPFLGAEEEGRNHYECLAILLKHFFENNMNIINDGDMKGNTALHYAGKKNDKKFIILLLTFGAYVGQCNKFNEPALANLNPKIFETYLDNCLLRNCKLPREDDYKIIFCYNFLVPPRKISYQNPTSPKTTSEMENTSSNDVVKPNYAIVSEIEPLLYMSRSAELRPLLKHPVLTSFLYLKWHKYRSFFYLNLVFYMVFWALLTTYILMPYLSKNKTINDDKLNLTNNNNKTNSLSNEIMNNNLSTTILKISITILLIILVLREIFQLTISPLHYLANPENWIEVNLIGITILILFCDLSSDSRHQISAVAIEYSWAELVLLIGRHPALSTNIEMFKTVSKTFLTFLAWYSILIVAFALSFYVLFCDLDNGEKENYFVDPTMSVFKMVVMLTGEFDAGSIPFEAHPGISHILFVLFVFLITIVLFNLLNGLAVSDTQSIKADAELVGYVSRVKLVSCFERMAMGDPVPYNGFLNKVKRLFCCLPDRSCDTIHYGCLTTFSRKISLFTKLYPHFKVEILPNKQSVVIMPHQGHKRKRRDIENDESCLDILCYTMTMDPQIVHDAKNVLAKREDEQTQLDMNKVFQNYKEQLEQYKQTLDSVIKKSNRNSDLVIEDYHKEPSKDSVIKELSVRLDNYNETLNILIRNSERNEERLNQLISLLEQKKPFLGTSSSDEDDQ